MKIIDNFFYITKFVYVYMNFVFLYKSRNMISLHHNLFNLKLYLLLKLAFYHNI